MVKYSVEGFDDKPKIMLKGDKDISNDATFKRIVAKYKSLFKFDFSNYKLIATRTPRYNNGKIASIPLEEFGGCWTYNNAIYLNADLKPVIKFYKLKDTSEEELKAYLLGHELGHGVWRTKASEEFKKKYVAYAKKLKFHTPYLDHVSENKLEEETFCELMAAIVNDEIAPAK